MTRPKPLSDEELARLIPQALALPEPTAALVQQVIALKFGLAAAVPDTSPVAPGSPAAHPRHQAQAYATGLRYNTANDFFTPSGQVPGVLARCTFDSVVQVGCGRSTPQQAAESGELRPFVLVKRR